MFPCPLRSRAARRHQHSVCRLSTHSTPESQPSKCSLCPARACVSGVPPDSAGAVELCQRIRRAEAARGAQRCAVLCGFKQRSQVGTGGPARQLPSRFAAAVLHPPGVCTPQSRAEHIELCHAARCARTCTATAHLPCSATVAWWCIGERPRPLPRPRCVRNLDLARSFSVTPLSIGEACGRACHWVQEDRPADSGVVRRARSTLCAPAASKLTALAGNTQLMGIEAHSIPCSHRAATQAVRPLAGRRRERPVLCQLVRAGGSSAALALWCCCASSVARVKHSPHASSISSGHKSEDCVLMPNMERVFFTLPFCLYCG